MAIHANSTPAPAVQQGLLPPRAELPPKFEDVVSTTSSLLGADALVPRPWYSLDAERGEPQTALCWDARMPWVDLEEIHDLVSLDLARARYLRRQASDAVDHLIALMDALDAGREDLEDDTVGEDHSDLEHSLGWTTQASAFQHHLGSADPDGEPSLGSLSAMNQRDWFKGDNRHDDGETTLGAPERHPYVWDAGGCPLGKGWRRYVDRSPDARQTDWAAGSRQEGEGEAEPGYDLPEGDDERCGSDDVEGEDSLGWPEHVSQLAIGREGSGFWGSGDGDSTAPETHGKGFVRCSPDDHEPSLGAANPTADLMPARLTEGGPYALLAPRGYDQTDWGRESTDEREHDDDFEESGDEHEDDRRNFPSGRIVRTRGSQMLVSVEEESLFGNLRELRVA